MALLGVTRFGEMRITRYVLLRWGVVGYGVIRIFGYG